MCSTDFFLAVRQCRRADALAVRCDLTHSTPPPALYLGSVEVRMDGDLRDVRTNPEPPALRPDELSNLVLSLLAPLKFPFFFYLAGNGPN